MFIRLDVFTATEQGLESASVYLEREMGDDSLQCVIPVIDEMCSTKFPSSMTVYTILVFTI